MVSAKIIRNKHTGYSEGYGFVEFRDRASAERALRSMNGVPMPGARGRGFRLNWASFGVGAARHGNGAPKPSDGADPVPEAQTNGVSSDALRAAAGAAAEPHRQKPTSFSEHSAFVGDLPPEVNDFTLQEMFAARYKSVRNARVVTDPRTGRSKGFGFVRFADARERDAALREMHGVKCGSRAMRLSLAVPRKNQATTSPSAATGSGSSTPAGGLATPRGGSPERGAGRREEVAGAEDAPAGGLRGTRDLEMRDADADSTSPTDPGMTAVGANAANDENGSRPSRAGRMEKPAAKTNPEAGAATTVFVGGLDPSVRESDLSVLFERHGALVYTKIPRGKGCGFVQFEARADAEAAIAALNGARAGAAGSKMRLSWVRANRERGDFAAFSRGAFFPGPQAHYASAYGGFVPGMHVPGVAVPGMPGGMSGTEYVPGDGFVPGGMEYGAPAYFPAPGGGWTAPGGGWVPSPPAGAVLGAFGQASASLTRAENESYAFASPEEAYAFAQQQYFAAQRARETPPAPAPADGAGAEAARGPAPPPTPPGAKKAAGGGAAA